MISLPRQDIVTAGGKALSVVVADEFGRLPIDRDTWNALAAQNETSTPFQTYEWFASWCNVFADNRSLRILLVFDGDRLVAIAPLILKTYRGNTRILHFASDGHADYCDFIAGGDKVAVLEAILHYLTSHRDQWDRLSLRNVPERSSTIRLLQDAAARCGLYTVVQGKVPCPTIEFERLPERGAELFRKESIKRPANYFARRGLVECHHITDATSANDFLSSLFEQHKARWDRTSHPSLFHDSRNRDFYSQLVRNMLPTGWLDLTSVELDRRQIALHFGFNYAGTYYWYKPSFDISLAKHSPGGVLLKFLFRHALDSGCTEFDFTIGNESFKKRYCNAVRNNLNILLAPRVSSYAIALAVLYCKRIVKSLLPGFR